LVRLRELSETVPCKEIEAAESEVNSLTERARALSGPRRQDVLKAPVSGVIASSPAVAGQVVDARELVFEVVDPTQLRIEALAYDPAMAQNLAGAALRSRRSKVPLSFVGAASSLREQALPMLFKGTSESLALGGRYAGGGLRARGDDGTQGRVPSGALMKNPANQNIVWVKDQAERFEPRVVNITPLDGASIAVTSGLADGDRVVVEGASLINQVR
jgi:hypothetical protein